MGFTMYLRDRQIHIVSRLHTPNIQKLFCPGIELRLRNVFWELFSFQEQYRYCHEIVLDFINKKDTDEVTTLVSTTIINDTQSGEDWVPHTRWMFISDWSI